jgi:hypothetical protein
MELHGDASSPLSKQLRVGQCDARTVALGSATVLLFEVEFQVPDIMHYCTLL